MGLQTSTTGGFQSIFHIFGRENDIFTFCKEGMPEHKWVAVDPKKGTFKITNYNCSKKASPSTRIDGEAFSNVDRSTDFKVKQPESPNI